MKPLWSLRLLPALALLSLLLAQTVLRSSPMHDVCIGFATGILIAAVVASFSVESISFRMPRQRSDVQENHIAP